MEILIPILILFVVLNCSFKLSLWRWWHGLLFGAVLAVFAYFSTDWALDQSKTNIEALFRSTASMQNLSVLITVETVINLIYCFLRLSSDEPIPAARRHVALRRVIHKALHWYPCFLIFPVVFYLLVQLFFNVPGLSFSVASLLFAVAVGLLVSLAAAAMRWLVPDEEMRVELHMLVSSFVCLVGLLLTQSTEIVYTRPAEPVAWRQIFWAVSVAVVLFLVGIMTYKINSIKNK